MIDPEIGFTSDVIKDPSRFVGRTDLIRDCIKALAAPTGLIAVFGKRGVGKSSLLRQLQQLALGDYLLAKNAGLSKEIPDRPRRYLTVYYTCDSLIKDGEDLLKRLCNDQHAEDGLLRLVPNDGKEVVEFVRSKEASVGADLKVVNWGAKGVESSKYARVVEGDVVQTFRNFVDSIVSHQVKGRMKRDALLILLDEFDVLKSKEGLGSLIKALSSPDVKFGICGIGRALNELVLDHGSVSRLIEQGSVPVRPMDSTESWAILDRAEELFKGAVAFDPSVKTRICEISQGYPYFTQLLGKECVRKANQRSTSQISPTLFDEVLQEIGSGKAFPNLEADYQKAIGDSKDRQLLLHLLAESPEEATIVHDDAGRISLKSIRQDAEDMNIQYLDQLLPRLLDNKFGPVLVRVPERQGVYEFVNPVFRLYVRLRGL